MKALKTCLLSGAACLVIMPAAVVAQEEQPLQFEAEVGYRYDDNITVDQSDNNAAQGDSSFLIKGSLGLDIYDKNRDEVSARYSFSQSLHDDLDDFDLQIHGFSFRGKTRFGKVNTALDYRYNFITLGGDDFLEIHNIRPNIGWLVAKKTYLTAAYEYRHLNFKDPLLEERDADRHAFASKVYYIFKKGANVTFGYKVSKHDAQVERLSYWGHTVDAGLKLPIKFAGADATYRLRYQYRQKDFTGVDPNLGNDPGVGEKRGDKRHTFRTSLRVPIGSKGLYSEVEYKYVNSNSNLASIDYNNNVVTFSLGWEF